MHVKRAEMGAIAIIVVIVGIALVAQPIRGGYEVASTYIAPNAERAYEAGERHFSALNSQAYNIDLAEKLFLRARALDPENSYVNHQLARIAFLRGDLSEAMILINLQIDNHGDAVPNSYYVRGLIRGYMGDYENAAQDYAHYISLLGTPNWAAYTDYAWVLLKAERFAEAASTTEYALGIFPENAWLLNTSAIALYELGKYEKALERAQKAVTAADKVTERQWLTAYPGNDPRIAPEGIATLKKSTLDNMREIENAVRSEAP